MMGEEEMQVKNVSDGCGVEQKTASIANSTKRLNGLDADRNCHGYLKEATKEVGTGSSSRLASLIVAKSGVPKHEEEISLKKLDAKQVCKKLNSQEAGDADKTQDAEIKSKGQAKPEQGDSTVLVPDKGVDAVLKGLSTKFSCIGAPQLVSRPAASTAKSTPSAVPSSSRSKRPKRAERFIIRNVSKVPKPNKVSNLNHRIEPVNKNLLKRKPECPVIFIGEPAAIDSDDFGSLLGKDAVEKAAVKEEDLYDIAKLQDAFSSSERLPPVKSPLNPEYPYPDIPHPSLNAQPKLLTYTPITSEIIGPGMIPRLNSGNVIRIVARTVPSATMVSNVATNSRKLFNFANVQSKASSNSNPAQTVVAPASSTLQKPLEPSVVSKPFMPLGSGKPVPIVPTTISLQMKSPQNVVNETASIVKVKLIDSTGKASDNGVTKPPQPLKIITASAVPSAKNSLATGTGKATAPPKVLFVPIPKEIKSQTTTNSSATKPAVVQASEKPVMSKTPPTITTTSGSVTKIIELNKSHPVANIIGEAKAESQASVIKPRPVSLSRFFSSKPLREGVEVLFEDGVRHFISNLKQMTHHDDEPIKAWSHLKKGAKVAARWIDGQMYDATVVGCYFSVERKLQPVVEVEKLPEKVLKAVQKVQKRKDSETGIGCAECRLVFNSISQFRKHQRTKCKSQGVIVPKSATVVTDAMIQTVKGGGNESFEGKLERQTDETIKNCNQDNVKCRINESQIKDDTALKKRRIEPSEDVATSASKASFTEAIFKKGTKFLHRWQLDDGTSKWYRGEVLRVVTPEKAFVDCEFEVLYKGESENYILKLYEDYPADIRILGKT